MDAYVMRQAKRMATLKALGLTVAEISERLWYSPPTIRKYLGMIEDQIPSADEIRDSASDYEKKVAESIKWVREKTSKKSMAALSELLKKVPDSDVLKDWPKEIKNPYLFHKGGAKTRGIPFEMTISEWWAAWISSGKWHLRGTGKYAYVMARNRDEGPYRAGNVYICTSSQNIADGFKFRKDREKK